MLDVIHNIHPNEILRCEVGSTLHGIDIGSDDRDLMGIMLEPENAIFGIENFEHITQRTAAEGERSGPDDIDVTIYGLKKWMRLAIQGNPSVIVLLYAPDSFYDHLSDVGRELIDMRDAIVSQQCIDRFLGYLNGQRERALKGKGTAQGNREGRREKWASHMVRLGIQGAQMATEGKLTFPMDFYEAKICKEIKRGEIPFEDALKIAHGYEQLMLRLKEVNEIALPEKPDMDRIHSWMKQTYLKATS